MSQDPKAEYRISWRKSYPSPAARARASEQICSIIISRIEFTRARYVALYCALPWEIDLGALWRHSPRRCVFPRARPEDKGLQFHRISRWEDLQPGFAGIREPSPDETTKVELNPGFDLILVPGARFDHFGGRIGTGGGYYDRFLASRPLTKWGVCYLAQLSKERLAQEPTDVRMDAVVTETGFYPLSP